MLDEVHLKRFWDKVDKSGDCWVWTACKCSSGYGNFSVSGRICSSHRVSYELHIGKIPDGLSVLHKCDNPACINPDHLFTGTQKDNMQDCVAKGRFTRGENVHSSRLTEKDVVEIRRKYANGDISQRQLARDYNMGSRAIHCVVHRIKWKHVE